MNITERTAKLKSFFSFEKKCEVDDSPLEIIPFEFKQEYGLHDIGELQSGMPMEEFCLTGDSQIRENNCFSYTVFNPKGRSRSHKAILLMHGLNERSWDKYLTWAEDLAMKCAAPVILFPIAFHMNRTPENWFSPRAIMPWTSKRREENVELSNSTFCNLALSSRLSSCPSRFYVSGRESIYNIVQMMGDIRSGKSYLFADDCQVNIFAYSVGALLSQTMMIANPDGLFSDSKLFSFCGGSIFEDMNGSSKDIMDQYAFDAIRKYYLEDFIHEAGDLIHNSFKSMVSIDYLSKERVSFFSRAKSRIKMVTLKRDTVIPTIGVMNAVGKENSSMVEELDFPFDYSHQIPFPAPRRASARFSEIHPQTIYESFRQIFDRAEAFV